MNNSGEQRSQSHALEVLRVPVMHADVYTFITGKHVDILVQDVNFSVLSTIVF